MKMFNKNSIIITLSIILFSFIGANPVFAIGPVAVDLLSANNFVILSQTGITNTGSHSSVITGDIGSSPISGTAMNNVFCSEVLGTIYGVDNAYVGSGDQTCFAGNPPLSNKTLIDNAILDMGSAYNDAAGRTIPTDTELSAGNIGGMTISPGLYKWGTDVNISTDVTLSGGINDVWIFQISGNLNITSGGSLPTGAKIVLLGGAQASNVFWQVGGATGATLGTYTTFNGNILSAKQIIIQTGAVLHGRAFAQTQVTLDSNEISFPPVVIIPNLTVTKIVVGGTKVISDFSLFIDAVPVTSGTVNASTVGAHTVSETPDATYGAVITGDCAPDGTITLSSGDNATCTITNTYITPAAPSVGGNGGGHGGGRVAIVKPVLAVIPVNNTIASVMPVIYRDQVVIPLNSVIPSLPMTGLPSNNKMHDILFLSILALVSFSVSFIVNKKIF